LLFRRFGLRGGVGQHADCALVQVEQGFLLVDLVLVAFAQPDYLPDDLGVEAGALGFGVNFLDVLGERLFFPLRAARCAR